MLTRQDTAKIYQFPDRRAARLPAGRQTAERPALPAKIAALGGAWYHEEAIRNDEPTRKS